jgi:hypothetical protein
MAHFSRPYFILLVQDLDTPHFYMEFGDYDREAVEAEYRDFRDHDYPRAALRILRASNASPQACAAAIFEDSRRRRAESEITSLEALATALGSK